MVYAMGKLIVWGLKAAWFIMKFVFLVILLPLLFVGLVGLCCIYIANPVVIMLGILAIVLGIWKIGKVGQEI
jgi:hypothetical protein